LITPNGRYYIAGLFGEDGLALLDLDKPEHGVRRILNGYGRGEKPLPTYKMPHLEGWAIAGEYAFIPAVGQHSLLVADTHTWKEVKQIALSGQPVFAIARPDGKQVWVNFALPYNDTIQIIDSDSLKIVNQITPGKAVLHMEFTKDSREVWVSVRDEDLVKVYDTATCEVLKQLDVDKPSGIFFSDRAHKTGL
jgi:protein NirF